MKNKIKRIEYNWSPGGVSAREEFSDYAYNFEVGIIPRNYNKKVTSIEEHKAAGECDKWFYDVVFDDGSYERIFNPNKVYFDKPDN